MNTFLLGEILTTRLETKSFLWSLVVALKIQLNRHPIPRTFGLIWISWLEHIARTYLEIFHKIVFYRTEKRKHKKWRCVQ